MNFKDWIATEIFQNIFEGCVFDTLIESDVSSFRESKKQLQDSILILRWNAMQKRSEKIKEIRQKIRSKEIMSVAPDLEELGYIDLEKLKEENLDDKDVENFVKKALKKALEEKDNKIPPDVGEDVLNPKRVNQAMQDFFTSMRNIFEQSFKTIKKKTHQGYQVFDESDIDEIANSFSLKMLGVFTDKNKRKSWNAPQGYEHLGNLGASELNDERYADRILNYIGLYLKGYFSSQQRKISMTHQPGGGTADIDVFGGNRDQKAALINDDILKNNLGFYQKYLLASNSELDHLEEKISKLEKLNRMTDSIRKEKQRLDIVRQILHLRSKHRELSVEPSKIVETLRFFRSNFLNKKYRDVNFLGALENPEQQAGASPLPDPSETAASKETKSFIHAKLASALNALRNSGKTGTKQALALCVFWELGDCGKPTAFKNISAFSDLITSLTKEGKPKGGVANSCEDLLFQMRAANNTAAGKSIGQLTSDIRKILGTEVAEETVRNWLANGIKFVCTSMRRQTR